MLVMFPFVILILFTLRILSISSSSSDDDMRHKPNDLSSIVRNTIERGFATTVAAREGYVQIIEILIKAGASQPACEEALIEASYHGRAKHVEILMGSDLIRLHVAVHALVTSCFRGFTDVVEALIKYGVDTNTTDRVLLQSLKPTLHTNIYCTALVAVIVSRQVPVVRVLLQLAVEFGVGVAILCRKPPALGYVNTVNYKDSHLVHIPGIQTYIPGSLICS